MARAGGLRKVQRFGTDAVGNKLNKKTAISKTWLRFVIMNL